MANFYITTNTTLSQMSPKPGQGDNIIFSSNADPYTQFIIDEDLDLGTGDIFAANYNHDTVEGSCGILVFKGSSTRSLRCRYVFGIFGVVTTSPIPSFVNITVNRLMTGSNSGPGINLPLGKITCDRLPNETVTNELEILYNYPVILDELVCARGVLNTGPIQIVKITASQTLQYYPFFTANSTQITCPETKVFLLDCAENAVMTFNGDVIGHISPMSPCSITINGNYYPEPYTMMYNGVITINGDLISPYFEYGASGSIAIQNPAAKLYINGDIYGGYQNNMSWPVLSSASNNTIFVYQQYGGKLYRRNADSSYTQVPRNNAAGVVATRSGAPLNGYGWVINGAIESADDLLVACQYLTLGDFVLVSDISATSTNYQYTAFYGSLAAELSASPKKITSLDLSISGMKRSLFYALYGTMENIEITNASLSGSPIVAVENRGTCRRCYCKGGTGTGLFTTNTGFGTIEECYTRVGYLCQSVATGHQILRSYHAANGNDYGTYLNDTQAKQKASYVGWDFNTIWKLETEGVDLPTLSYRSYRVPMGGLISSQSLVSGAIGPLVSEGGMLNGSSFLM